MEAEARRASSWKTFMVAMIKIEIENQIRLGARGKGVRREYARAVRVLGGSRDMTRVYHYPLR